MKKIAGLFLIVSIFILSNTSVSFAQDTQTEEQKAQAQRHQIRQETDNKIREMANETYVNRVKTSDKQTKSLLDTVMDFFGF